VQILSNFSPWVIQVPELYKFGYSSSHLSLVKACLLGAIQAVAKNLGKAEMAKRATVRTSVHIGSPTDLPGFGLAVDIKVEGVDKELLEAGHKVITINVFFTRMTADFADQFCPYSRALDKGIVVNVSTKEKYATRVGRI